MAIKDIPYIDEEVVRLVKLFLGRGDDVIAFMEGHTKDSIEFKDFPLHCVLGTSEAELIEPLKSYEDEMLCIRKNSTCGFITNGFQQYLEENRDILKELVFVGVCSDLCVMNAAIPTKMYMNQYDIDCDVIVPENAIDTFDASGHSRDEYNQIAKKILRLNGIKVPKGYER